jgi:hypothetical protein
LFHLLSIPEVVVPLSFYERAPKKPRGRYAARLNGSCRFGSAARYQYTAMAKVSSREKYV